MLQEVHRPRNVSEQYREAVIDTVSTEIGFDYTFEDQNINSFWKVAPEGISFKIENKFRSFNKNSLGWCGLYRFPGIKPRSYT